MIAKTRAFIIAPAVVLVVAIPGFAWGAANDAFADAAVIPGASGQTTGSNIDATKEPGEPDHAGEPGGKSVWWRWTAPQDGAVSFNTFGSDFDTLLAVYTGPSVDTLSLIVADEDCAASLQSRVTFIASASTVYHIAVDGYDAQSGSIVLSWSPCVTPPNDDFADAAVIPAEGGHISGSSIYATKEPGEPDHAGNFGGASVWWRWTAPRSGKVYLDTYDSDFATLLAVYTGSSLGSLNEVAADYLAWYGSRSRVKFMATAGETYHMVVDGFSGDSGDVGLTFAQAITVAEAKRLADTTTVFLADAVVSAAWQGVFYVESDDRTCGVRVEYPYYGPDAGDRADVKGSLATNSDGERCVAASYAHHVNGGTTEPLGMSNRLVGGGDWHYVQSSGAGQRGVTGGAGLNNVGLLVTIWGRVTQIGGDYLYINDGSDLRDGTFTGAEENVGIRVICDPSGYDDRDFLRVVGISSMLDCARAILATEPPTVVHEFPQ